ncbi:hydroxysqualene dehydroxylase HpnE [Streptomyces bohaiensis]|uniref:hydroxysqualene dehydroxylase HpnE n=1 Tax=Streptomyces bohaiensis TaxID=1431344 RepID=UPI0028A5AE3C|nr:hydroxysqualene dehydroxylase HpnE [Streptomyces bohaiensis]
MTRTALVIGGGLAGTTAALDLADRGWRVTLAETRPRLGGLAFSFRRASAVGDLTVDNGQHVYLRCCTAYRGFLDRIGGSGLAPLQRRLDVPVLDADTGRAGRLTRTALPVPLHLSAALARYPHLSAVQRLRAARAAWSLRTLDPADPALDTRSFGDWLHEQGQDPRSAAALWDLVGVATLNARADDVSLALAVTVFRTGLLTTPGGADIGLPAVPLGELHSTLAGRALADAGVTVLLRARARRVARPAGRTGGWTTTLDRGGDPADLTTDAVVLAVPQGQTHALLPTGALQAPDRLLRLADSPILNVHVVYDRPVLRRPFLAALGSPVQWVFDRTPHSGLADLPGGANSQYLALSQSAATDEIDLPAAELRRRYLPELERLLPAARTAAVRDFFVTRERTATFAPAPGTARLRPGTTTRAPGLYLAGAWTDTGWPATMEGAVRSGHAAARAAAAAPAHTPGPTPIAQREEHP